MRATINDIARHAEVSKTTVSFAFNEPSKISKETREKVLRIAEELGYVPDPVARFLTTRRTGTIGFLLPQPIHEATKNPYLFEVIQGLGSVCQEAELNLNVIPPVKGCISDAVRRAAVDSFVTVGIGPDSALADLFSKRRIPCVTIDGEGSETTSNVGVDDRTAAAQLMAHVLGKGIRSVAVFQLRTSMVKPEEHFSRVVDMRMAGFGDALRERDRSVSSPGFSVFQTECSMEGGESLAKELLSGPSRPEVIICMADIIALGVYSACRSLGLDIPSDVSVASFDDIPQSRLMTPGLTTIRQPGFEKGRLAARFALDLVAGKPVEHRVLPTELVIRGSVVS